MTPNVDHFIEIGSQHKICEDYILSGRFPIPHIILSDGCSSSDQTEMGARFLCHLAKQYICQRYEFGVSEIDYNTMGLWIIHNAEMIARQMGLKKSCLDATLSIALFDGDAKEVVVFLYGDGYIFSKKDGALRYISIEYSNNAPYYLSYKVDPFRDDLYGQMKNDQIEKFAIHKDNIVSDEYAYDHRPVYHFHSGDFDQVFIASDGIASFIQDSFPEPFDIFEIAPKFFNFKNTKGEFLKRRCGKETRILKSKNINHYDDLSIGGFLLKEEL